MSDENQGSMSLFEKEHAAREKYIYYICSVSAALLAYNGKDFQPSGPLSTHEELMLWCLGCLTASFIFGLAKILTYIHALNYNRDVVFLEEELSKFNKSLIQHLQNPGMVSLSNKVSGSLNQAQIQEIIIFLRDRIQKQNKSMNWWHGCATFSLVACQLALLAGFVLMLLSKMPFPQY